MMAQLAGCDELALKAALLPLSARWPHAFILFRCCVNSPALHRRLRIATSLRASIYRSRRMPPTSISMIITPPAAPAKRRWPRLRDASVARILHASGTASIFASVLALLLRYFRTRRASMLLDSDTRAPPARCSLVKFRSLTSELACASPCRGYSSPLSFIELHDMGGEFGESPLAGVANGRSASLVAGFSYVSHRLYILLTHGLVSQNATPALMASA